MAPKVITATLTVTQTSAQCVAYRLVDAQGRVIWRNRVYATPAGHQGARRRLARWAEAHGVKVVEGKRNAA
jgi:hypothetical protein